MIRILFLAPHPFFINRGTPIDVLLVLRVLAERHDTKVDLLAYAEGEDVGLPNLRIYRTPNHRLLEGVRPGFSIKKLVCDVFLFFRAWSMARKRHYDLVHAGEEAVFVAMFLKAIYKIPYVYDLDSSMAQQLVEQRPFLRKLAPMFNRLERLAVSNGIANLPVCNALAELCEKSGSRKTFTIHDISQLKNPGRSSTGRLKREIGAKGLILLYIGNLEVYQGIDLLLESFQLVCGRTEGIDLAIIGGTQNDIQHYRDKSRKLGIEQKTHFLGPRPFEELDEYLAEADILVAPRTKGVNTPMKVFPYLHSGKPVLLTDLYTHSQVIPREAAYLAPADPAGFSRGILELAGDEQLRARLGKKGREFVEKEHTYTAHRKRLHGAYNWIENMIERQLQAANRAG
jgi:glycosyltransferase involved in cell wall biosynthesis